MAGHISEDDLERYAMGKVKDEGELAALEEHLLVCGWCIGRAVVIAARTAADAIAWRPSSPARPSCSRCRR